MGLCNGPKVMCKLKDVGEILKDTNIQTYYVYTNTQVYVLFEYFQTTYTVQRKCLMEENFDEYDESKFHCQNFVLQMNSGSTCNIHGSSESVNKQSFS